jgi:hypothetical protein
MMSYCVYLLADMNNNLRKLNVDYQFMKTFYDFMKKEHTKAKEALRTMQDLCHSIKVLEGLEEVHPSGLRALHFLGGNFCPNWMPVDLVPLGFR